MAAVLLTALVHSAMEFGYTIHYLEDKAGIADVQSAVLRRITRDIRESWWVELESSTHLKLANADGEFTEYYLEDGALRIRRPNGDEGLVIDKIEVLSFTAREAERKREGAQEELSVSWYVQAEPVTSAISLESADGGSIALTFDPPINAAELGGSSDEQVLGTTLETVTVALDWVPEAGPDPGDLTVSLYETRGPGKPKTHGDALASILVPGESLPQATDAGGSWNLPSVDTVLSLSVDGALDPGRGYAVVLQASAGSSFVLPAHLVIPSVSKNLIGTKDAGSGSNWVVLPLLVPFELTGTADLTSTTSEDMIEMIAIVLKQTNRPEQARSASVLSQTLGESAWLGVIPGEEAP
ncbi:MAG: hypothetical protein DRQ55_02880 [Planctomycetota bacterium]|nr:MAG: hypothetical protein DRQ55_02880 [Planctomycetota bacterium]